MGLSVERNSKVALKFSPRKSTRNFLDEYAPAIPGIAEHPAGIRRPILTGEPNRPVSAYARPIFSRYDEARVGSLGSLWPQQLPVTRTTLASLRFHAIVGGRSRYLSRLSDSAESKLRPRSIPGRQGVIEVSEFVRISLNYATIFELRARHNYRANKDKLIKLPAAGFCQSRLRDEQNLPNGADISLRFHFYPRDALLMKARQESRTGNNIAFDGALVFRFAGNLLAAILRCMSAISPRCFDN